MPNAAALVASGIAQVKEPRPVEAKSIHPSDVTGTAYYVVRLSDYQLEATMATGDATAPVRFVGSLVPGQTVTISVPGETWSAVCSNRLLAGRRSGHRGNLQESRSRELILLTITAGV